MKKDHMVGTRLPVELLRELQFIEDVEQSDRSTTIRRLLARAIQQWKLEHYVRLMPMGSSHSRELRKRLESRCGR